MKNYEALQEILSEANEVKDRLSKIADDLEKEGFSRKAQSCMNLIYRIEEWQNRA